MRCIGVINYKGGTGKTATSVNLAHALALNGYRVLLVDTDIQGSAGHHLGVFSDKSLYDVLIGGTSVKACIVRARPGLDMICSNERLFPAELSLAKMANREKVLHKGLSKLAGYDFVILDCAPSMSVINQNVLLFAKEIILPVSMEYLALVGVKQLLKNIKLLNKMFNRRLVVSKVVPTFYDSRKKKSKDIIDSLNRVFPGLLSTPIRDSLALSEAPGFKQTVFEYDSQSNGALDYLSLMREVLIYGK